MLVWECHSEIHSSIANILLKGVTCPASESLQIDLKYELSPQKYPGSPPGIQIDRDTYPWVLGI